MITTSEAAAKLGVSIDRVQALIRAGRLPAAHFGRAYMIDEKDLALVKNRKPGRPKKDAKKASGAKEARKPRPKGSSKKR